MTDLREAMRQARRAAITPIDVPEWGRKVYLRPLSAREQIEISESDDSSEKKSLRILILSIVNEDGERELGDDDMDVLMDQPFPVLIPLLRESATVNGFSEEELKGAIESFAKAPDAPSSST